MTWRLACLLVAILFFAVATIIALGQGSFTYAAALIPAGLTLFAIAHIGGTP